MESADYVHLLRLNEQASREAPERYRQRVLRFAVLGYVAVFLFGLLALAGLLWLGWRWQHGARLAGWMIWGGLACLGLLWATLQGLRVPFRLPEGQPVAAQEAPELFAGLARIRAKVQGPALHQVLITDDFNAAIVQQPMLLGLWHRNFLLLGWPLLAALEPKRMFAVVAHEYGHLRGDHGKLSAWIYRTRMSWARLSQRYEESSSALGWLMAGFVAWYFPRFNAMSFALARQDEYEADRVSARLFGAELAAHTLQEVALKAQWFGSDFWRLWWRRARTDEAASTGPCVGPYAGMNKLLQQPLDAAWQREALQREFKRLAGFDDTHPVLKDRLASLGQTAGLPRLSAMHSLRLLGEARARIALALDAAWWQANRADWRAHGERLRALNAEAQALSQRAHELSAAEWLRWADAVESLSDKDPTPWLERALLLAPEDPHALRRLARRHAPSGDVRVGAWLETLYQRHEALAWAAAELAQTWVDACSARDAPLPPEQRRLWRERLESSRALEEAAWASFQALMPWDQGIPLQLDEAQLRELRGITLREADLRGAWVGEQALEVKPARRHFTLWLQCRPGLSDDALDDLAQRVYDASDLPGRARVVVLGRHVPADKLEQARELKLLVQRR